MRRSFVLGSVGVLALGGTLAWTLRAEMRQEQQGLLARAAVSSEAATRTVLAAYPGARITESEIEDENGVLIYSFELQTAEGVVDVEVDAMTGELVVDSEDSGTDRDVDHEDDRDEGHRSSG